MSGQSSLPWATPRRRRSARQKMPTHLRMYAVPSPRLSAVFYLSDHFYRTLNNILPLSLRCHRAGVFLPAAAHSAQWLSVTGESLLRVKGTMLTSSQVKLRKYISRIYCTISSLECFLKIYKLWEWTVSCVAPTSIYYNLRIIHIQAAPEYEIQAS